MSKEQQLDFPERKKTILIPSKLQGCDLERTNHHHHHHHFPPSTCLCHNFSQPRAHRRDQRSDHGLSPVQQVFCWIWFAAKTLNCHAPRCFSQIPNSKTSNILLFPSCCTFSSCLGERGRPFSPCNLSFQHSQVLLLISYFHPSLYSQSPHCASRFCLRGLHLAILATWTLEQPSCFALCFWMSRQSKLNSTAAL